MTDRNFVRKWAHLGLLDEWPAPVMVVSSCPSGCYLASPAQFPEKCWTVDLVFNGSIGFGRRRDARPRPLPGKDSFGPPAAASGLSSKDGAPSRRNSRLLGVQQNAADTARSRIRYRKGTPRAVRRVRRILYRPQPDMGGSRETHWTDSHVLQGCDRP